MSRLHFDIPVVRTEASAGDWTHEHEVPLFAAVTAAAAAVSTAHAARKTARAARRTTFAAATTARAAPISPFVFMENCVSVSKEAKFARPEPARKTGQG